MITEEYRRQQEWMHNNTVYGVASAAYGPVVSQIIDRLEINELLDYGCGSRLTLLNSLTAKRKVRYQPYDPAVPQYADAPVPSEMVACIDVLEHVEPQFLEHVLDDLDRLTLEIGLYSVHCKPARKFLPDGRNAHLTQQPLEWWMVKLAERWEIQTMQRGRDGGWFVVHPKPKSIILGA